VAFATLVHVLGTRGLTSVLIEGGGAIAAAALRAGVVDRVVLMVAPMLLGGDGVAAVGPLGLRRVARALRIRELAAAWVGPDLMLEGRLGRA
jgi:diaminohydroxyphosphoribosylaminopyrimidine deaminase/5-amino-6-(5-phosphoribosylamino)uracil reductase